MTCSSTSPLACRGAGAPQGPVMRLRVVRLGASAPSSVFPAPTRAACRAKDIAEGRRLNITEIGRSLSAQAWGICDKVAEVDNLLLIDVAARRRVREIHPEVCFWALNGRRPMQHSKATKEGVAERMALLTRHEPRSAALLDVVLRERRRKDVQANDVLDALVGFVTAQAEIVQRLQGDPACDQRGLAMEMLFRDGDASLARHEQREWPSARTPQQAGHSE